MEKCLILGFISLLEKFIIISNIIINNYLHFANNNYNCFLSEIQQKNSIGPTIQNISLKQC
jgi:hypothetical protein